MKLIGLRCPECARDLPAHPEQRIFSCTQGHGPFRLGGDRLWPMRARVVLPATEFPDQGEIVLLPVWVLPLAEQFQERDRLPAQIRVPAIGLQRLPMVIDFARNLTRSPAPWEESDAGELAFDGASLEAADAMEIAELVALGLHAGWPADEVAQTLEIPFAEPRLVLLPSWRHAQRLQTLCGDVSCPSVLFDEHELADRRVALRRRLGVTAR